MFLYKKSIPNHIKQQTKHIKHNHIKLQNIEKNITQKILKILTQKNTNRKI